jgi:hypothetical protein
MIPEDQGRRAIPVEFSKHERTKLLQHAIVKFFSGPIGGGLHEGEDDRMRGVWLGRQLRLEERRQKESMCGRFDSPNFVLRATGNHRESGIQKNSSSTVSFI